MKFTSENYSDLRKYFQNSFVKFSGVVAYQHKDGKYERMAELGERLFYVGEVQMDYAKGHYMEDGQKKPFIFHLHNEKHSPEIDFILPKKSYFNHGNRAFYLYRIPARQYHRGITEENTAIGYLDEGGVNSVSLNLDRLQSYVGKQAFLNFRKREDMGSYAVSRRMAVCGNT